ncbi:Ca-activated chloride channel family protein [Eubacterium ruminantium]|nr:Ca-activated chloride channel family protein [Eubacterium ruminantium]
MKIKTNDLNNNTAYKKVRFRKSLALSLTAAVMISSLYGCGNKKSESDSIFGGSTSIGTTEAGKTNYGKSKSKTDNKYYNDALEGNMIYYEECLDEACPPGGYIVVTPPNGGDSREYNEIIENAFIKVSEQPDSTFAADTDTASYSNMRGYIAKYIAEDDPYYKENGGIVGYVPADAIRIEELINYFNYDYAEPAEGEPFSYYSEIVDCPWNDGHKLLMLGLKTEDIDTENLKDNNFVFLIDSSGSMDDANKLPLVKTAFARLVDELGDNDTISIVTYAGSSEVVLDGVKGSEKQEILDALDNIMAYGSTDGSDGIVTAYELAESHFLKNGNNRVILATDGDLNVGITDEDELVELIDRKKKSGVYLSVMGFGFDNLKDNKLEALADNGNGQYSFIDNAFEAKKALVSEMGGNLVTVAKDVKLNVNFNGDMVDSYRLIGYENRLMSREDFDDDTKDGGEIGAGHRLTVLYELDLTDTAKKGSFTASEGDAENAFLTLSVRYKEPDKDVSKLYEYKVGSESMNMLPSENIRWAEAVAAFGMILRDSEFKGTADFEMVRDLASKVKSAEDDEIKQEFIKMVDAVILQEK